MTKATWPLFDSDGKIGMKILVTGAGATGGYFGGRLAQAGRDVTFLVRERRAQQLRRDGLVLASPHGDARLTPAIVTSDQLHDAYDLVLLSVKAYALQHAIDDIAPAIGPDTMILPLLNGMRHLDVLDARFGAERVLGGVCAITATVDQDGTVRQLSELQHLTYGDRQEPESDRLHHIHDQLSDAGFPTTLAPNISQEMWQKLVFLASLAATSCLMRGTVGQVMAAPGGREFALSIVEEAAAVAEAHGHPIPADALAWTRDTMTTPGSTFAASMFRDLTQGYRIEADHIIGDLIDRAHRHHVAVPLLATAYTHLKVYEQDRENAD